MIAMFLAPIIVLAIFIVALKYSPGFRGWLALPVPSTSK